MMTTARLATLLREKWDVLSPGEPLPARFSFMLMTKGRESVGKIVLLAFLGHERVPRFVIKLARLEAQNRALEAEYLNLKMVAPHGTYGGVRTPQPLLGCEDDGRFCLVESMIEGVELGQASRRSPSATFIDPIVDWLIHLGRATVGFAPQDARGDDLMHLIDGAAPYVTKPEERRVLDQAAGRLLGLRDAPIPRVFEQRDMGTWNLLVSREGTIGVLDWESSRAHGFPAWDLFYFLAHYGFMVHETSSVSARLNSARGSFLDRHGFGATVRSAVGRYATAMSLREEWLGLLFLGCWLHHAVSETSRLGIRLSESLFWQMAALTLDRDCRLNFVAPR